MNRDRPDTNLAELVNTELPDGIDARVRRQDNTLEMTLSAQQADRVDFERLGTILTQLPIDGIETLVVAWQPPPEPTPIWRGVFDMTPENCHNSSWWVSMLQGTVEAGSAAAKNLYDAGKTAIDTAANVGQTIGNVAAKTSKTAINAAAETSNAAMDTAAEIGATVGQAAWKTATNVGQSIGDMAIKVGNLFGTAARSIAENPLLQKVVERVDLVKAEEELRRLEEKYPHENPNEIAHRLMVKKAMYAGGSGIASSIIPGSFAALMALDLTAMAGLQAEMIYQIAGAYGADLQESDRKAEVLAIFAAAFGGHRAIQAGLKLLRMTPAVGAVIGASTNAAAIYTVGRAACAFYESQTQQRSTEESLEASRQQGDRALETAISQEIIADTILVRLLLKSRDDIPPWEEMRSQLEPANLSPASVEAIAAQYPNLPPLEKLLEELEPDFAASVLARYERLFPEAIGQLPRKSLQ